MLADPALRDLLHRRPRAPPLPAAHAPIASGWSNSCRVGQLPPTGSTCPFHGARILRVSPKRFVLDGELAGLSLSGLLDNPPRRINTRPLSKGLHYKGVLDDRVQASSAIDQRRGEASHGGHGVHGGEKSSFGF